MLPFVAGTGKSVFWFVNICNILPIGMTVGQFHNY